jgi:hypothetical protein
MMPNSLRHFMAAAVVCSGTWIVGSVAFAQTMGTPERFSASAMDINTGRAGNIDITVDRWSGDKQRDALISTMLQKGPEKLLDALQDMPAVGHFGAPGNLSWDLHFARRASLPEGGERVTLITDRRISFWESANQPRSIDYPFTVIELRLNRDGEGEGTLSIATKVIYDKKENMITLENYQTSPVRLTNVKRERTHSK